MCHIMPDFISLLNVPPTHFIYILLVLNIKQNSKFTIWNQTGWSWTYKRLTSHIYFKGDFARVSILQNTNSIRQYW